MKLCIKCKAPYGTHTWGGYCSPWCERNFDKENPPLMVQILKLKKRK